jgi:hypothetical protein
MSLSIYSNENNESIYDDLLPRGSEAEYDQWKQNDLHQVVEGIYKRLESTDERLCNNTGSKVASLQQTDTSSLESDIKEIKRMPERLSGEPVKLSEKVNLYRYLSFTLHNSIMRYDFSNVMFCKMDLFVLY